MDSAADNTHSHARAGVGRMSWSRRAMGIRLARRQILSRQFCFAIICSATMLSKVAHLHAHRHSIPPLDFVLWGATFVLEDLCILILARFLTDHWSRSIPRIIGAVVAILLSIMHLFMASVTVSFYITAGAEIHWRQLKTFLRDSGGAKTLSSESTGTLLIGLLVLSTAWIITPYAHPLVGKIFQYLPSFITRWCCVPQHRHRDYLQVDQTDDDRYYDGEELKWDGEDEESQGGSEAAGERSARRTWIILVPLTLLLLLRAFRPQRQAFSYLSQTLVLSPWENLGHQKGVDMASLIGAPGFGEFCDYIGEPPAFEWLPEEKLAGFEDWYPTENGSMPLHYAPARDCSHISNLGNNYLDPIRDALEENDVKIKHVILIKLETTRKDVFPMKRDSYFWNRIAGTHPDNKLPADVEANLTKLTPTIEYLTGESAEGEGIDANTTRGGISALDAFTASTYTLKSIIGSVCGIMPLATDFNQEYRSHFYNPCLTHVLEAFNSQLTEEERSDDFTSWPWQTMWMQSVTDTFDKQDQLTPVLGFNTSVTKESMNEPSAEFYPPNSSDINYFGLADTELKPYLKSAIENAEAKQERLFLTHLTGTTHHPWGLPEDWDLVHYLGESIFGDDNVNNYLNTVHFIDGWLKDILSVLDETGVANETLIVMAGDHGASLPEDGGITPFDNPNVGVFRVPLVFSHPALPPLKVEAPVSTIDILATTLDLLISSASLEDKTRKVATDVLPLYEGQSLLRPLEDFSLDGHKNWHYTVMNSGGSWLAMRSTTSSFRVAVPLQSDVAWRFTDLANDPQEEKPISGFDWPEFIKEVREHSGDDAVTWLEEAAQAADWWLAKNKELWHWEED